MSFEPSPYQEAIFDWVIGGSGNAVVSARAGSGKTTTLVEALKHTAGDVLLTAFNKHIAKELERRVPFNTTVRTLHSLGLAALRNDYDVEIDPRKLSDLCDRYFPRRVGGAINLRNSVIHTALRRAVSIFKATLLEATSDNINAVLATYNIDTTPYRRDKNTTQEQIEDAVREWVPKLLDESLKHKKTADFDDMLWLPVMLGIKPECYDWVFGDELQDWNRVQQELVLGALGDSGRFVGVGDPFQAIYRFRGADHKSMKRTRVQLDADAFPLTVSYRCPSSHIALARTLVGDIEAREEAPEGQLLDFRGELKLLATRGELWEQTLLGLQHADPGTLVLCRTNAPLVKAALYLGRRGTRVVIRGRDMAGQLKGVIDRTGPDGCADLIRLLEHEADELRAKLEEGAPNPGVLLDRIDKCETLCYFAASASSINDLKAHIDRIFSDRDELNRCVVFSTVHKAKGLEANAVLVIRGDLMPHPMATGEEELQEEKNIQYVAWTRSKDKLVLV